jgi:hypothetical protein
LENLPTLAKARISGYKREASSNQSAGEHSIGLCNAYLVILHTSGCVNQHNIKVIVRG